MAAPVCGKLLHEIAASSTNHIQNVAHSVQDSVQSKKNLVIILCFFEFKCT